MNLFTWCAIDTSGFHFGDSVAHDYFAVIRPHPLDKRVRGLCATNLWTQLESDIDLLVKTTKWEQPLACHFLITNKYSHSHQTTMTCLFYRCNRFTSDEDMNDRYSSISLWIASLMIKYLFGSYELIKLTGTSYGLVAWVNLEVSSMRIWQSKPYRIVLRIQLIYAIPVPYRF